MQQRAAPRPAGQSMIAGETTSAKPVFLAEWKAARSGYRFRVEPVSKGLFRIVDSSTLKVKGWRLSHEEACHLADQLEGSGRPG